MIPTNGSSFGRAGSRLARMNGAIEWQMPKPPALPAHVRAFRHLLLPGHDSSGLDCGQKFSPVSFGLVGISECKLSNCRIERGATSHVPSDDNRIASACMRPRKCASTERRVEW